MYKVLLVVLFCFGFSCKKNEQNCDMVPEKITNNRSVPQYKHGTNIDYECEYKILYNQYVNLVTEFSILRDKYDLLYYEHYKKDEKHKDRRVGHGIF